MLPEGWDYGPDQLPPRSSTDHVTPIGVGTADVERFTSVLTRRAWAEWMSPGQFVLEKLARPLGYDFGRLGDYADAGRYFGRILHYPAVSLNGNDRHAATWVVAAEPFFVDNIYPTTLLPWGKIVLPGKRLLHGHGDYCAACFEAMRSPNAEAAEASAHDASLPGEPFAMGDPGTVYEPLIWCFADVKICLRHRVRLSSSCPSCGRQLPVFSYRSRPGHCSHCDAWLGLPLWLARRIGPRISERELEWQTWVIGQLGLLIATSPTLLEPPNGDGVPAAVETAARAVGGGNQLARRIGREKSVVSGWRSGHGLPTLPSAIRVCAAANLSLPAFLKGIAEPAGSLAPAYIEADEEFHRVIDYGAVEHVLKGALESYPPPTLSSVLGSLDLDDQLVRSRFPQLCAETVARHRRYRVTAALEAEEAALIQQRSAMDALQAAGRTATRRAVEAITGQAMRRGRLMNDWRARRGLRTSHEAHASPRRGVGSLGGKMWP